MNIEIVKNDSGSNDDKWNDDPGIEVISKWGEDDSKKKGGIGDGKIQ